MCVCVQDRNKNQNFISKNQINMVKKILFVMLLVIPTVLFAQNTERGSSAFNRPRGYMGQVVVGGGIGADFTDISLSVINGFRFSPQFAIGLGVGLGTSICKHDISSTNSRFYHYVPVFLHLRSDFLDRRVSPFVALNFGSITESRSGPMTSKVYTDVFSEIILGCSFNVGQRHRMSVGLSGKIAIERNLGLSVGFSW